MAKFTKPRELGTIDFIKESTRQRLAGIAVGGFFGIIFIALAGWLFGNHSADEIIKLVGSIGGVTGGIVGAIIGFYFGNAPKEGSG
jgi:hypothetical protein